MAGKGAMLVNRETLEDWLSDEDLLEATNNSIVPPKAPQMPEIHKPMPVAGYTEQSQSNVDLANELKVAEERYLRILDRLSNSLPPSIHWPDFDQRCVALARTKMNEANMWAVRAIFKPQRITLPEDNGQAPS